MKKLLLVVQLLIASIVASIPAKANHIVGGELRLKASGGNVYEVSLIQFWEKNNLTIPTNNTPGNRDNDAEIYIYSKKNDRLLDRVKVVFRSMTDIDYQNRACATSRSMNTVTGIYTGMVTLDPNIYKDPEGYYIIWERCCRNDDINNIVKPGDNGMTFYLEFPPVTTANSSPEFQTPNGQYICSGRPFSMNMSAVDPDGDELRYSLAVPLRGNTTPGIPTGDDSPKLGYPAVTWSNGISLNNVIPGPKPLTIDNKGFLHVTAGSIGLYVLTIQCEEFRNGKRIGLVRRDFQLLVIDCNDEVPAQPIVMHKTQPVNEVLFCLENSIQLETELVAECSYQWQLNGLNIPGATSSTLMVSDTGQYLVVKSFNKKCSRDTTSVVVYAKYADPPEAKISADRIVICQGEKAVLLANGGTLASNLTSSWMLDNSPLSDEAKMEVAEPGLYKLTITDIEKGCVGNDTITIAAENLNIRLPEKVSVMEGGQITISPIVDPDNESHSYQWSPPDGIVGDQNGRDIISAPSASLYYVVNVTSANGCTASDTIFVNVIDKMHIPTAFSPNNDGRNDLFEIFNAKDQIENITIFNRWGTVIFRSEGYPNPWNGTYKEMPVPAGTYPYIIKTASQDFRGEILLLR